MRLPKLAPVVPEAALERTRRGARPRTLIALLAAGLATAVHAEDWSLVGRHGECAPLRVLQRKLPDLPDVRSPEALAAYLDARRLRYSRRTVSIGRAQAVEFEVAEVGLAVLLAPESACRSLGAPTR